MVIIVFLCTELTLRKHLEIISSETVTLALEDPKEQVGSGGATINALLVVTEFLSAKAGFTVSSLNLVFTKDVYSRLFSGCECRCSSKRQNSCSTHR